MYMRILYVSDVNRMADVGLEKLVITEKEEVSKGKETNVEDNKENNANEIENGKPACAFCKKAEPTKRCSKRHPKCLKKLFCDEACENLGHKKKDDDKKDVKDADKKKEDAKKKKSKQKKNPEHAHCSEHRM